MIKLIEFGMGVGICSEAPNVDTSQLISRRTEARNIRKVRGVFGFMRVSLESFIGRRGSWSVDKILFCQRSKPIGSRISRFGTARSSEEVEVGLCRRARWASKTYR